MAESQPESRRAPRKSSATNPRRRRNGRPQKGLVMTGQGHDLEKQPEEHDSNSHIEFPEDGFFSYYRDDNRKGGLEVKWTIRVATGAEAARLDDRQNQAIRELLSWAHRTRQNRKP